MSKKPEHVFLIDGSGFIFRAYYGIKADMTRPDGTRVNAVYGFTRMLMKLIEDTDADHVAVIFDHARKTFRNDIYPAYKANRSAPPEALIPQFDLVRDATRALNVAAVGLAGYEADDLIATYTRHAVEQGADPIGQISGGETIDGVAFGPRRAALGVRQVLAGLSQIGMGTA